MLELDPVTISPLQNRAGKGLLFIGARVALSPSVPRSQPRGVPRHHTPVGGLLKTCCGPSHPTVCFFACCHDKHPLTKGTHGTKGLTHSSGLGNHDSTRSLRSCHVMFMLQNRDPRVPACVQFTLLTLPQPGTPCLGNGGVHSGQIFQLQST